MEKRVGIGSVTGAWPHALQQSTCMVYSQVWEYKLNDQPDCERVTASP